MDASSPRDDIPFVTDTDIRRTLKQAEDGLIHAEYALGVIRRDLAAIRLQLEPREPAPEPAAA